MSRRLRRHRTWHARRRVIVGLVAGATAGVAMGIGVHAFMNAITHNSLGLNSGSINAEGSLPAPAVNGRDVTVSWPADTLSGGTPTTYYVLRDNSGASGTCSGVLSSSTLSCTDTSVPSGTHIYTVVPTYLMWTGPSASVTSPAVGAAALSLSPSTFTSLANTTSATVSNFVDNESITFRLDDATTGTVLSTSPASVSTGASGGGANATVSIPANIADGTHTVYAVGSLGDQASQSITVNVPATLSFSNGSFTSLPGTLTGGAITYFRASESVSFHLDSASGTILTSSPSTVSIGTNGQTSSSFTVTIPSGIANGSHTVYAVGGSGSQATYAISVNVATTFSITSGQTLTTLPGSITGGAAAHFGANENLIIRLDSATGTILSTSPATVTTDANGTASGFSATIPANIADGTHTLVALGNTTGLTATSNSFSVNVASTFSITAGQSISAAALPAAVSGGALGYFASGETITVHLDTVGGAVLNTSPSTITTDANGTASGVSATIPAGTTAGTHTLWAVGNTSARTAQSNSFTVTASATGLSPTSGPVSTAASIVAKGFIASHSLTVSVGGSVASISSGGTSDASGNSTIAFSIPAVPNGAEAVVVSDGTHSATSGTDFTVTASATGLTPTSGAVGTNGVSITAQGFAATHALTVTVGGVSASITSGGTTGSNGSSTVLFTIPAVPNGARAVMVSDGTHSATSAINFTVTASATALSPTSGAVGTTGVTISAQGFLASTALTVKVGGNTATITNGGTTGSDGSSTVTFTIPATSNGAQPVTVSDGTNTATSATNFTIQAALSVSPTSGASGTTGVTLTGTGFTATKTISVTFGGSALTISPASPLVSATGGWTATFTVPSSSAGAQTITATDTGGVSASTTFTVTASVSITTPNNSSSATQVHLKKNTNTQTFTITGTGFAINVQVTLSDSNYVITNVNRTSSTTIIVTVNDTYNDSGTHTADLTVSNAVDGTATSTGAVDNKG